MMRKSLAKKILCGLLAAGVVGVSGSALAQPHTFYTGGNNYTKNKTVKSDIKVENKDDVSAQYAGLQIALNKYKGSSVNVNLKGNIDVIVENTGSNNNPDDGLTAGIYSASIQSLKTSKLTSTLGTESSTDININARGKQTVFGVFLAGQQGFNGPQMTINGNNLNIDAVSDSYYAYGINVSNYTTPTDIGDKLSSKLVINTENTVITANSNSSDKSDSHAIGIAAYSQGEVEINGNLKVDAETAICTRGNSKVTINKNGNHVVQLNGNVRFDYDGATSGTSVDADVNINLDNEDSYLNGSIAVSGNPPDDKNDVNGMNMNISNGAAWNMTGDSFVNNATVSDGGAINVQDKVKNFDADNVALNKGNLNIAGENSEGDEQNISITKLSNDGGAINMQGSAQNLEVTDLSSNNGTINMYGSNQMIDVLNDFNSNGATINMQGNEQDITVFKNFSSDNTTINLQGIDQNISLNSMSGSGATVNTNSLDNNVHIGEKADETKIAVHGSSAVTDKIASGQASLQDLANVVTNMEEGSEASLADKVTSDANDIIGGYSAEVGKDGKVIASTQKTIENPTNRAISDIASISLMTWRQENNDMNKRLGELRDSKGEHGAWARMARGESKYGAQNVKNQYNYYQVGYDEKLSVDPNWTVGVALTRTEGNSTFSDGSGENKHTGVAVYGSYLNDNGSFIDLIAKYARMDNDFKTNGGVGNGDYETNGYSISAEYGKRFTKDNGFWIEPQVELTYGTVGSANYTTSKGASVYQESIDSLVGRLGFSLGKNIKQGNVYVRASYLYDFDGETKAVMSKAGAGSASFEQDLGGGWWEVGIGTNLNLSDATHLYFDVEKTYGGNVATPWQWNAGVRWSF